MKQEYYLVEGRFPSVRGTKEMRLVLAKSKAEAEYAFKREFPDHTEVKVLPTLRYTSPLEGIY